MATVPAGYQQYVNEASAGTGIPVNVVAAQAQAESNFNPHAVSPTGAEGFWQFEPGTYNAVAAQAGVPRGTEFNVADETKAYVTYMNQLLQQEGGSVFKALEAYNAGPGNLPAGAGYASGILAAAHQPRTLSSKGGSGTPINATLTSFPGGSLDPLNWPGQINNAISNGINSIGQSFINGLFNALGIPTLKDLLQRLGLILLGVVIILVGFSLLGKGIGGNSPINITTSENTNEDTGTTTRSRTTKTPVSRTTKSVTRSTGKSSGGKSMAGKAMEAAVEA